MNYNKYLKNREYSIPICSVNNYSSNNQLENKSDELLDNIENSIDTAIEKVRQKRQKVFKLGPTLNELIQQGKASIEPEYKINEFARRLNNYMKPIRMELKKKQHQSHEYAKRTYLD